MCSAGKQDRTEAVEFYELMLVTHTADARSRSLRLRRVLGCETGMPGLTRDGCLLWYKLESD